MKVNMSRIQKLVKHLRWTILLKNICLNIYLKHSILGVWQGFEYAHGQTFKGIFRSISNIHGEFFEK